MCLDLTNRVVRSFPHSANISAVHTMGQLRAVHWLIKRAQSQYHSYLCIFETLVIILILISTFNHCLSWCLWIMAVVTFGVGHTPWFWISGWQTVEWVSFFCIRNLAPKFLSFLQGNAKRKDYQRLSEWFLILSDYCKANQNMLFRKLAFSARYWVELKAH